MDSPQPLKVVAASAHPLVQQAATELQRYLDALFGVLMPLHRVTTMQVDPMQGGAFLIGEISDAPVAAALAAWGAQSPLSDQGFLLRSGHLDTGRTLVIAGGSPVATLWAVYHLVSHYGVRFEMMGDFLPASRPFFWMELDERLEPAFRTRGLSPKNNLAESAASWDLPDYRRYIDQMVKLKFNLFTWRMREWGPWLQYEFKDYRKERADLYYGYRYPINEKSIGAHHFGGEDEFYPAPFRAAKNDGERFAIAHKLLSDVLEYARRRGIQIALALEFTDIPTDLKDKINEWLPDEVALAGNWANAHLSRTPLVEYGVNPERIKWQNWAHPLIQELAQTRIRALVESYPGADFYLMEQTEHVASIVGFDRSLDYLDQRYHIRSQLDRGAMVGHADRYDFLAKYGRYQATLEGELEFLFFYDQLFEGEGAREKVNLPTTPVGMTTGFVMQEYFPIFPAVLRPGTVVQAVLEYGFHRTAQRMESFAPMQQSSLRSWVFSTFQDDNNMWLPQLCVQSLYAVVQGARHYALEGMNVQHWEVRPYEICTRYYARLCWDPDLSPEAFYDEELASIFGSDALTLMKAAFKEWEAVDVFNREKLIGLAACWHGAFAKFVLRPDHFDDEEIRISINGFQRVVSLFRATRTRINPEGASYLEYYLNRLEFAIMYEDLALLGKQIGRVCLAIQREAKSDRVAADALRNQALALIHQALRDAEAMIRHYAQDIVAVEDRAVLAGLNRWVWRYLLSLEVEVRTRPVGEALLTDSSDSHSG